MAQRLQATSSNLQRQNDAHRALEERHQNLGAEHLNLTQQLNIANEHCRNGDHTLRQVETAYRQAESNVKLGYQARENLHQLLEQERSLRQKAEARIDASIDTTKMLAQWLYVFSVDNSELSGGQKKMRAQVEYATLYMERDSLKAECERLNSMVRKQRGSRASSQAHGQPKKSWWAQ